MGIISSLIILQFDYENDLETLLDKSGPFIGANFVNDLGYYGEGIKIGVIDTGVDYFHPDLYGFGPDGKIINGYNYINENNPPLDTNGHGTEVVGIIAADGELKGIAPKSSIIAYKVSVDGNSVSPQLIIKAIEQAIKDEVDIINISLGVNRTNSKIDQAVNAAIESGIVVVTAAGNDGPGLSTIGTPGKNVNVITVGASYNNSTASLVATLEVEGKQFQVLPMIGTKQLAESITAEIVFGEFGRESDLIGSYADSIVLVERGSDVEGEIVFFSDKEYNIANVGGRAIIVYNNEPRIFFGELIHEFVDANYQPRIPALSISKEDGIFLKELVQNKTKGVLNVFYHPDFVAYFSSRGPVSSFYIKPDLVAPGAFINTTLTEGRYNFTSGTSFAAPHVTGAVALLLQKNPELKPNEIKSILVTTTDFVEDAYENKFPLEAAGSGRLNVTRAFNANLIILPHSLTFNLSSEKQTQSEMLELVPIDGNFHDVNVKFVGSDIVNFDFQQKDEFLEVTISIPEEIFGDYQGALVVESDNTEYHVPILVHKTQGAINVFEEEGKLNFEISHPNGWSYAKISVINKDSGKTDTTSVTPKKDSSISVTKSGEHWVIAKIESNGTTFDAYEVVNVKTVPKANFNFSEFLDIPERPIIIVVVIGVLISLVGLKLRN
ncbi:MAG: S8 family serine peptidase [Thaumarchaeota archaeon]|nr:S8 family serine peptidase [Nitrososphaerota archaeon]